MDQPLNAINYQIVCTGLPLGLKINKDFRSKIRLFLDGYYGRPCTFDVSAGIQAGAMDAEKVTGSASSRME